VKRTALVATLALVAVTPAIAHAAPPKAPKATKRTVTLDYKGALGLSSPAVAFNSNCSAGIGDCMEFTTVKGEKTITFSAVDQTGQPVGIQVFTDDDFNSVQTLCGSGTLTVSPKTPTAVSVRPAYSTCTGQPTTGTITAVITNR
jgi:hypothetical protein